MAYSYRCGHRHCRQRRSYRKPLEAYKRRPRGVNQDGLCATCGKGHLNPADDAIKAWNRRIRDICPCGCLRYPHRPGDPGCGYSDPWEGRA